MNILLTGNTFGYPVGMAATNYVQQIVNGFQKCGDKIRILIPVFSENKHAGIKNQQTKGVYKNALFEYTAGITYPPEGNILYRLAKWRSILLTLLRLIQYKITRQLDVVIFYGRDYEWIKRINTWCKVLHIPFLVYIVEWYDSEELSSQSRIRYRRYFDYIIKHVDGVVVISKFLQDKVSRRCTELNLPQIPCLRTSILSNPENWKDIEPVQKSRPYILYCASLNGYPQDAEFIIDAFYLVGDYRYDLLLVGTANTDTQERLQKIIDHLGLANHIFIFTDYLPEKNLFSLYAGAEVLLAPLSSDDRSLARFPSKIADYLLSGRPVVTTEVGEPASYLRDQYSAYLAKPNSVEDFAEKINEALSSPNRNIIGKNGQLVAKEQFNFFCKILDLKKFIVSLGL